MPNGVADVKARHGVGAGRAWAGALGHPWCPRPGRAGRRRSLAHLRGGSPVSRFGLLAHPCRLNGPGRHGRCLVGLGRRAGFFSGGRGSGRWRTAGSMARSRLAPELARQFRRSVRWDAWSRMRAWPASSARAREHGVSSCLAGFDRPGSSQHPGLWLLRRVSLRPGASAMQSALPTMAPGCSRPEPSRTIVGGAYAGGGRR